MCCSPRRRLPRLNVTLQAGAITESITVTSDITPAVETETANVATSLTTQAVRSLPQIGRNPYELVRLAPGVFGEGARGGNGRRGRAAEHDRAGRLE